MKPQQGKVIYIDCLRIFAAYAVILLHAAAPLLLHMKQGNTIQFMEGNLIDSATRWCVPIFFMISGALLLNSKRDFNLLFFLKKRFSKVLIPFIAFSVIYFFINNHDLLLKEFIIKFANNAIAGHLWFFYALIAVYLFSPVLIIFVKLSSKQIQLFILFMWFIFCCLIPFINGVIPSLKINFFGPFGIYLGYFLLGYMLFNQSFSEKLRYLIYLLGAGGYFVTYLGTHYFTARQEGNFFPIFYTYNSPNVLMMAISIFVFFKYVCNFTEQYNTILSKISSLTFGVYLIHPYILKLFKNNGHLTYFFEENLLINTPLVSLIVFFICLILSYIISFIPFLRRMI
jgi:surface polysaccharide O-acyltransferase-like enzyme